MLINVEFNENDRLIMNKVLELLSNKFKIEVVIVNRFKVDNGIINIETGTIKKIQNDLFSLRYDNTESINAEHINIITNDIINHIINGICLLNSSKVIYLSDEWFIPKTENNIKYYMLRYTF